MLRHSIHSSEPTFLHSTCASNPSPESRLAPSLFTTSVEVASTLQKFTCKHLVEEGLQERSLLGPPLTLQDDNFLFMHERAPQLFMSLPTPCSVC